jgi:iron complex outermembrane recepter protein
MRKELFLFCCLISFVVRAQITLTGSIRSKNTKEALPGALVYFPDLKTGCIAQNDGSFTINHLPKIKTLVQVKLIGYKSVLQSVNLNEETNISFEMEESVIEEAEIVVTGVSKATEVRENPVPMVFVDTKFLEQNASTNAIDALVKVPGVNALSTGPNISKPVIRGLSYSRVLTLFDGVRQESQQWGDEHGIEMDQYLVDRVEIVKGPASLIYGSDALGGVVNMLPQNPVASGIIKGTIQTNFQTNNGLRAGSVSLNGNRNGKIWGFRYSHKEARDFQNPIDGKVFNTGFLENDLNVYGGVNRKWGYSHFTFSSFDSEQEVPDGSRDSASRKFTKQLTEEDTTRNIVSEKELNSYKINVIHQRIQHYRLISANNFIIGTGRLGVKLAAQSSIRREYSHPQAPGTAGLFLKLKTGTYDLKYYFPEKKGWESAVGINGMYQDNNTDEATEFVVPAYSLFDVGPFVFVKKDLKKWNFVFGARYDHRSIKASSLYIKTDPVTLFDAVAKNDTSAIKRFDGQSASFSGFSASGGVTRSLGEHLLVKGNVARGYRAPNISELSARGIHPGTGYLQIGNADFKPELNTQYDLGLFFDSEHLSLGVEMFSNLIENYIFNQKIRSASGGDSLYQESGNNYPVFKYQQTKAQLTGAEGRIDIHPHPLDWLHFENAVSLVYAENKGGKGIVVADDNKFLPFIPPVHTVSDLRAEFRKKRGVFSDMFAKIGFQYYFTQDRVFSENGTETKTPGYGLLDAGLGATILNKKGKPLMIFGVFVSNLLDTAYQSNMNRLKYFEDYPVNGSGRSGIYSMGRNFSFKLTIPLDLKSS